MTTGSLCGGLATLSVDWNPADRERLIRLERRRICVCACGFTATEFKKKHGRGSDAAASCFVFCVCNNPQSLGFFVASDSGETTRQSLGGSTLVALGTLSVVSIIPLTGQRPLRWDWTHSFLAGPSDLLTYFSPVAIVRLLFQKKGRTVRR